MGKRSTFEHFPALIEPDALNSSSQIRKRQKILRQTAALVLLSFRSERRDNEVVEVNLHQEKEEQEQDHRRTKTDIDEPCTIPDDCEGRPLKLTNSFASADHRPSRSSMKPLLPSLAQRPKRLPMGGVKPLPKAPMVAKHLSLKIRPINLTLV
mmetsp:Transcript_18839/g.24250  ORF Transcript_18839/g.24250 Transcript_18839/m.24250 type:complete len:153 (-) Transcript_18839:130-588(-)